MASLIPYYLFLIPALALAYPLGLLCKKLTHDESPIYSKTIYFPTLTKILLITSAIAISQNHQIFLTSIFLLILIYTWQNTSVRENP